MRIATLVLAVAALVFACADFWRRTRPRIVRSGEEAAALLDHLAGHLARAQREGAPPAREEVAAARDAARTLRQDLAALRVAWFADAQRGSDYLVPRAARPAAASLGEERDRIAQALLALPAELKFFAGLTAARLGLRVPSLTESVSTDPAELADQGERTVVARHLLDALRAAQAVEVDNASLQRSPDGRLALRLDVVTDVTGAIALLEHLLGASDAAPPRRLRHFALRRVEPREWGRRTSSLASPPVRVSFVLDFEFPAAASGAS